MESVSSSTSVSLVAALKRNDETGWSRLVNLYGPLIYEWCRRSGLSPDRAADVSQEVFKSVVTGIEAFQHDGPDATFRGWLWTITRNRIRDQARVESRAVQARGGSDAWQNLQQMPELDNTVVCGDVCDPSSGSGALMQRALETIRNDFNEQSWRAFELTTFEHLNSTEAAVQLGVSPNAVRKAKARVLRRLREELGDVV